MKNMLKVLLQKLTQHLTLLPILIGLLTAVSCQKEIYDGDIGNGEKVVLKLSVSGILDDNRVIKVGADLAGSEQTSKETKINGVNASIKSSQGYSTLVNSAANRATDITSPMQDGMTYRILLYYEADGRFATSALAKSGEEIEIKVEGDQEFHWYAYSYNDSLDIPLPDTQNPEISTPTDRDLIYADGTVSTSENENVIPVKFEHKLSLIELQVNAVGLYSEILKLDCSLEPAPWYNQGNFNIRTGETDQVQPYEIETLSFSNLKPNNNSVKVARFYTADATGLEDIRVNLNLLEIQYPNADKEVLIPEGEPQQVVFDSFTSGMGKMYKGEVCLWKTFKKKIIWNAQSLYLNGSSNAGARAPLNMLLDKRNFGTYTNSVVKVDEVERKSRLYTYLKQADPSEKPDIIILSNPAPEKTLPEDTGILEYLDEGGVVLFFEELLYYNPAMGTNFTDDNYYFQLLQDIMKTSLQPNIRFVDGSPVYSISGHDDQITNGPFGDIRNAYWGKQYNYVTGFKPKVPNIALENLPLSDVTVYSTGSMNNVLVDGMKYDVPGVTMFKHNKKNIFWIADPEWIETSLENGTDPQYYKTPFATDIYNFPVSKENYGSINMSGHEQFTVSNSILFGNLMHWAMYQAEFFGIRSKKNE